MCSQGSLTSARTHRKCSKIPGKFTFFPPLKVYSCNFFTSRVERLKYAFQLFPFLCNLEESLSDNHWSLSHAFKMPRHQCCTSKLKINDFFDSFHPKAIYIHLILKYQQNHQLWKKTLCCTWEQKNVLNFHEPSEFKFETWMQVFRRRHTE